MDEDKSLIIEEDNVDVEDEEAVQHILAADRGKGVLGKTLGLWRSSIVSTAIIIAVILFSLIDQVKWQVGLSFNLAMRCFYFVLLFVAIYESSGSRGTDVGKKSEEWIKANADYRKTVNDTYDTGNVDALETYCEEYRQKYVEKERRRILRGKIKYEDYVAHRYAEMTDEQVNALKIGRIKKLFIIKANHVKPLSITADVLLDLEDSSRFTKERFRSVEASRRTRFLKSMVPTIINSLVVAQPIIEMIIDLSWQSVMSCAIRVALLLYTGYKGFRDNVLVYAVDGVKYRGWQTKHLRMFICWQRKNVPAAADET